MRKSSEIPAPRSNASRQALAWRSQPDGAPTHLIAGKPMASTRSGPSRCAPRSTRESQRVGRRTPGDRRRPLSSGAAVSTFSGAQLQTVVGPELLSGVGPRERLVGYRKTQAVAEGLPPVADGPLEEPVGGDGGPDGGVVPLIGGDHRFGVIEPIAEPLSPYVAER